MDKNGHKIELNIFTLLPMIWHFRHKSLIHTAQPPDGIRSKYILPELIKLAFVHTTCRN